MRLDGPAMGYLNHRKKSPLAIPKAIVTFFLFSITPVLITLTLMAAVGRPTSNETSPNIWSPRLMAVSTPTINPSSLKSPPPPPLSPNVLPPTPAITPPATPPQTLIHLAPTPPPQLSTQHQTAEFNGRPLRPRKTLRMRVTAYSPDERSCGKWADGVTASGKSVFTNGMKLVAADTRLFPFGTILSIPGYHGGRPVPVLDRGGKIKGHRLDVLYPTHEEALEWGVQYLDVTIWEYAD